MHNTASKKTQGLKSDQFHKLSKVMKQYLAWILLLLLNERQVNRRGSSFGSLADGKQEKEVRSLIKLSLSHTHTYVYATTLSLGFN